MEDLLNPFEAFKTCPACGEWLDDRNLRYCESGHERGTGQPGTGRFIYSYTANRIAHLHVLCIVCGYEWLEHLHIPNGKDAANGEL